MSIRVSRIICFALALPCVANGARLASIDAGFFSRLQRRNIGPAIMGSRIADIEGVPGHPAIVYVASASSSGIDHVLAAPTEYQRAYYTELQQEFVTDVGRVNKFLTTGLPDVNESLSKHNGPALMGGPPIAAPAWLKSFK